jgi:hypothetical protein
VSLPDHPDPSTCYLGSRGFYVGHRHAGFCVTCGSSVTREYQAKAGYERGSGLPGSSLPGEGSGAYRAGPWVVTSDGCRTCRTRALVASAVGGDR